MKWTYWRPYNSHLFLGITLGLLCLSISFIVDTLAERDRARRVDYSLELLDRLERCQSNVVMAQRRAGGGDSSPELPDSSVTTAHSMVQRLIQLTENSPAQAARVRALDGFINQIANPAAAPSTRDLSLARLANTVADIRVEEQHLLAGSREARSAADLSFRIFTVGTLLGTLLLVLWAYLASKRYMHGSNQTEFEIRELNARLAAQVVEIRQMNVTLADRVAEKTAELEGMIAKLKQSNQELERFAYIASHDMQEPLRQIASFNNLLALRYGSLLDSTANRYLDHSVSGAKRLQLMLRGLLQYTITTPATVRLSELPVMPLMESVLQQLRPDIEASHATVGIDVMDGLSILGDRDMTRTLVLAVISNAIKFRQAGVAPEVSVAFDRTPQQWSLQVADNGIGVEERFMPKMFEMFSRFHPVGQYQGAGVGLALSKRIVDCHGGTFTVKANPDRRGTIFAVEVPIPMRGDVNAAETGRFPY